MRNKRYSYTLFLIAVFWSVLFHGQNAQEKVPIKQVLDALSKKHQVRFNYQSDLISDIYVLPTTSEDNLNKALKRLESETNLRFFRVSALVITITRTFEICGYLQNVMSQQPLADATIQSNASNTISDARGYFKIIVGSLDEIIQIRYLGFKPIKRVARFFTKNQCDTIPMYEEQETITGIVLKGYIVRGIDKKEDGSTGIDFSRFTTLPGLIETDVLQTVQALPGIQSIDETVSNINIRGGSNDQNLILWDGIKMYQSGHFFGLISSFNPQITQKVTVVTNGAEASLTDGVSGTIDLRTDEQLQSRFKGSAGSNFISADAFADIPLGEKSSIQIAGRRSIDDLVRTPTFDVFFDRVTQETEIAENEQSVINSNQSFSFFDASFRWLYKPTEDDNIRLNFIVVNNDLTFDETASLEGITETRESSLSQNSIAAGLYYDRRWNFRFSTQISVYNTDYRLQGINANVLEQQRFLQENIVSETGAKINADYNLDVAQVSLGYQFTESEITNLNDIDVPRFLRRDSEVLREHAVFVQAFYQDDRGFSIKPGLRTNYIGEFDTVLVEPRLSINKAIGEHFQVEVLGEFKHQNTSQIINFQNDFLGVERRRWQLTDNDSIPILESKQASLGTRYAKDGWLVDATVYYKTVDGITAQSQGFTTKFEFAKATGSYEVTGIDFLLRKQLKNLSSWLSYSYMVNEYTFESLEDVSFPSNFDNMHSITVGTSYSYDKLRIAAGLNYRTGKPTSIPLAGSEVVDDEINFGLANSVRIANFFRVDASLLYKWPISKKLYTEIGASVWNVLDRENTINNFFRLGEDDIPTQFSRFSLGTTANAVVRVYF